MIFENSNAKSFKKVNELINFVKENIQENDHGIFEVQKYQFVW